MGTAVAPLNDALLELWDQVAGHLVICQLTLVEEIEATNICEAVKLQSQTGLSENVR